MEGQACQRKVADVQRCVSYVIMRSVKVLKSRCQACQRKVADVQRCVSCYYESDVQVFLRHSEKRCRRSTLCIVCYYEK